MKQTVINKIGEFIPQEWDGKPSHRVRMYGRQVLVLPDLVPEKTKGGIFLSSTIQDQHELAATTGIVVAIGQTAFAKLAHCPKLGERVQFERYAGQATWGADGRKYITLNDTEISSGYMSDEEYEAACAGLEEADALQSQGGAA